MANRLINSFSDFSRSEYSVDRPLSPVYPNEVIDVKNCDINFDFILIDKSNLKTIKFNSCIFLKSLELGNLNDLAYFDFINCEFRDKTSFRNIKISGKSRFWESKFIGKLNLMNVHFQDLADFFKVTFNHTIIFYKVDFNGTTVFTSATFEQNVLFTYTKFANVVIFTTTIFKAGIDFSQSIITGKINFQNSDLLNFNGVKDITNSDKLREAIEETGVITLNNQRETYRILKKFAKDNSNQFQYLEYSKLENETYFKQLEKQWSKNFDNYSIFLLNKWSNDHNMSWSRGVIFTATIGFLFFYFSIISTEYISMGFQSNLFWEYLGKYLNFLSPLHKFDLFDNLKPNTGTIFFDFLGRIFISYGFYQTIQAFRKHKG